MSEIRTSITPREQVEAAAVVLLGALNRIPDLMMDDEYRLKEAVFSYLTQLGLDRKHL